VTAAAALAALVATDFLTGRRNYPDELIEVLEPIETPFDTLGRYAPKPEMVMLTDAARSAMAAAAAEVHPCETGGILIGLLDGTGAPCVTQAVEFRPERPSSHRYIVPEGLTTIAVDAARQLDGRLVYLGEWHSHPTDQPASRTDRSTMAKLAAHPDTGDPVLLVLRPIAVDQFTIDAYMQIKQNLVPLPLVGVGPIAPEDQP
jgi:proteasome lid subunit RPN8/RPN11